MSFFSFTSIIFRCRCPRIRLPNPSTVSTPASWRKSGYSWLIPHEIGQVHYSKINLCPVFSSSTFVP